MFSRKAKDPQISADQHEQLEYAQKRIRKKKNLYRHIVLFLIGAVFLFLINKILKYGEDYDWYLWAIVLWGFLVVLHTVNVYVTHPFLGPDWERGQREKLVAKQRKRIQEIQKEIETEFPLGQVNKKKRTLGTITMIAAAGENNELGKDNDLLWHLPDDFKRFKTLTTGHRMIMGRKTFESFPKPLRNRIHIIITRDPQYRIDHPDCLVVHSLEEALEKVGSEETPFIIGGGEIYSLAMDITDIIELTRVHGTFEADAFFPHLDPEKWELIKEEYHPEDEKHAYPFTYLTYRKKAV